MVGIFLSSDSSDVIMSHDGEDGIVISASAQIWSQSMNDLLSCVLLVRLC